MGWEESMFAVFDDLEQQAAGLHLAERDAEVADLSVAEYSLVTVAARLHASLDLDLRVRLVGGHQIAGRLARLGRDWILLVDSATEWIVRLGGITAMSGLSPRAESEDTWSVMDHLTLRALLRRLSAVGDTCLVHFSDAQRLEGRIGRVGKDFFELGVGADRGRGVHVVPVASMTALQGRLG